MPNLLVAQHRPGFYFRVITEGQVRAGDDIVRTRRGRHELSVADVDALLYLPDRDVEQLRKIVDVPALSPGWQQSFNDMLTARRLLGCARPSESSRGGTDFARCASARYATKADNVLSICLEADDHAPLPRPLPGQYLTVRIPGAGDPTPLRSYSLSGDPSAGELPHQRQTRRARPGEPVAARAHRTRGRSSTPPLRVATSISPRATLRLF